MYTRQATTNTVVSGACMQPEEVGNDHVQYRGMQLVMLSGVILKVSSVDRGAIIATLRVTLCIFGNFQ